MLWWVIVQREACVSSLGKLCQVLSLLPGSDLLSWWTHNLSIKPSVGPGVVPGWRWRERGRRVKGAAPGSDQGLSLP